MSTIHLVSGGARSGKSGYAQALCEYLSPEPIYLATSKEFGGDQDFHQRISRHKDDRGDQWTLIEEPLEPSKYLELMKGRVVLVDCCTLWLTNFMMEEGLFSPEANQNTGKETQKNEAVQRASEKALERIKDEFEKVIQPWDCTFIIVTNEIGSGTHANDYATRKFVDAQGWFNQFVAERADTVIHMVCGVATMIKGPSWKPDLSATVRSCRGLTPTTLHDAQRADMLDHYLSKRSIPMDPKGYVKLKIDALKNVIVATYHSCIMNDAGEFFDLEGNKLSCHGRSPEPLKVWEARTAKELTTEILERWDMAKTVFTIGHAGYIGREAQKAEDALYGGRQYQQD